MAGVYFLGVAGLLRLSKIEGGGGALVQDQGGVRILRKVRAPSAFEQKDGELRFCLKTLRRFLAASFSPSPWNLGGPGRPPRREDWRSKFSARARISLACSWPSDSWGDGTSFSRSGLHGLEDQMGHASGRPILF